MSSPKDPSTQCSYVTATVKHYHLVVDVDFTEKKLKCAITLKVTPLQKDCSTIILDMSGLNVLSVTGTVSGESLKYEVLSPKNAFGSVLQISLPGTIVPEVGGEFQVTISYETTASCSAVQWLEPAQTAGKTHPYLYTQCQPIHARSMMPCMDTPSVKSTYTAEVTTPTDLTALMSATRETCTPHPTIQGRSVSTFSQKVPIPSYLLALVVGALESRPVGRCSKVWCEKEMIEQAEWDFSETGKVLEVAEALAGPYVWGIYDVLVMPPSFPYGGMENPCLTFVTPTILSPSIEKGDKSGAIRLVAHEVSHSWTGNLVTNVSWEHFWLNEGWTTYLERKIIAKLHGEPERHLAYINGWKALEDAVEHFKSCDQLPLTALVPSLTNVHPDDAFSSIPYEKGSLLLFYLETLLGGPGSMDSFIKEYLSKYKFVTVYTDSWKQYFLNYFKKETSEGLFDQVEWDRWFYEPGMPPYTPTYDTSLANMTRTLADKWCSLKVESLNEAVLSQFTSSDLDISSAMLQDFVNALLKKAPLPTAVLEAMDSVYGMSTMPNTDVKSKWLQLCLKSGLVRVFPLVVDFVTKQGRMKYVRPLYRCLYACNEDGKELARKTFIAHRSFYHSVAASQLAKDLQLS